MMWQSSSLRRASVVRSTLTIVLASAALLQGCGRHVVITPESVRAHNEPDWTITSSPPAAVATSAAAPSASTAPSEQGAPSTVAPAPNDPRAKTGSAKPE